MKNRDVSFDIARSFAALWVVGFWHLACYDPNLNIYTEWGQSITNVFLATFMFISGYMLSKYSFSLDWGGVIAFYKKRFFRFWILYFVSAVTLYLANLRIGSAMFVSKEQLFLSLAGLTTMFPPHPGTLWFMSMLMLFYWITPLLKILKSFIGIFGVLFTALMCFVIWQNVIGKIDVMVYLYFPIYFIGLFIPHHYIEEIKKKHLWLILVGILIMVLFIFISLIYKNPYYRVGVGILYSLGGICMLLGVSDAIAKLNNTFILTFFSWIAYASLSAYLFHRHIYSAMHKLIGYLILPINIITLGLIFLPSALICAYYIQHIYDYIISKLLTNEKS